MGYLISYLPDALLAKAVSAASLADHRRAAVLVQRTGQTRLVERFP
jgi:hypothetical protein